MGRTCGGEVFFCSLSMFLSISLSLSLFLSCCFCLCVCVSKDEEGVTNVRITLKGMGFQATKISFSSQRIGGPGRLPWPQEFLAIPSDF